MDPLETVFLFCFVFGLALSVLSVALGGFHQLGGQHGLGHGGHGGHLFPGQGGEAGHGAQVGHGVGEHVGHSEPGAHVAGDTPSPINFNTATVFLAFFGGVGYVLYGTLGVGAAIALMLAVVAGFAGGGAIFMFLVKVLLAGERVLDPEDFRMEGSIARVSRSIRPDGIGEIVFSREGSRHSEGARSATGEALAEGAEVVIVRYERGLAYVEPWATYAHGPDGK